MFEMMTDHPSRSPLRGRLRVVSWERASNVSKHREIPWVNWVNWCFLASREFKECLTSAWNSIFIPLVQELWPLLAYSSLSMTHGAWARALLMFRHLSAPSRAARLKVSTTEPLKAASPNWEPNTPTRSSRWTTCPVSWRSRASWRRPGRGLWGAERWPSWHCREEGISHVARTRWVNCFSQFHQSNLGMWVDA